MSAKKRVILCTYSSIYSSIVLEQLIDDRDIEVVAIINSTRVLRPSLNPILGAMYQLKTSGLSYSSYLFFVTDFFRLIQPVLNLQKACHKSIHSLAKSIHVPIFDTKDINTTEATDFIDQNNPDFILCAHFNQLIKEPILTLSNVECINIHPSLLPNYKGVDPVFFAMKDKAKEIGVTLHRMNSTFDSGEILLQSKLRLDQSKTLLSNNCQLFSEGTKLAKSWIKNNTKQTMEPINNSLMNNENYDSWPSREDVKKFKNAGYSLMYLSSLWKKQ